ncbi:MAG: PsbP-related protein [Methanobacterium sp.]
MKRWAPIIIILLIVIFISGCVQPQIYNSNGISFQYPGDWKNDYKSNVQNSFGNSATVLVSLGKENNGVVVCKMNTPQVNLNDLNSIFKSNMQYNGYQFISENKRTVDGNDVQEIIFKENSSGIYGSCVFLQNNNETYLIIVGTPNNDKSTVNMVLDSFKVQ